MENLQDAVQSAKDSATAPLPNPPELKAQSAPRDLKARLEWGEPALTIVDIRDREAFNEERITGAVNMPLSQLVENAENSVERVRDLYIYGGSDDEAAQAASSLRNAGFTSVAVLQGGLAGWKAIQGPTEGNRAKVAH